MTDDAERRAEMRETLHPDRPVEITSLVAFGSALARTSDADLERLQELGGLRWHMHEFLFALPLALEGVWIGLEPLIAGGGRLHLFVPPDRASPEVYDFPQLADAITCAFDMAVHRLDRPRVTHRWYRRTVYEGPTTRRPQFLRATYDRPLPEIVDDEAASSDDEEGT